MNRADPRLTTAESIALDRLITIARDSDSEREARLAAEAIFTLRRAVSAETEAEPSTSPAQPAATSPRPAAPKRHPPDEPLTTEELSELIIFLPHVNPQRFIRKHTPKHWRAVLAQQRQLNHQPARAIGPPSAITKAA